MEPALEAYSQLCVHLAELGELSIPPPLANALNEMTDNTGVPIDQVG